MKISVKPKKQCSYDSLSPGEVLLVLIPGKDVFGRRGNIRHGKAVANTTWRVMEDFILQGGVDTSLIKWWTYEPTNRTARQR